MVDESLFFGEGMGRKQWDVVKMCVDEDVNERKGMMIWIRRYC